MNDIQGLHAMLNALRAGQPRAVDEFLAQYEPFLRRAVRRSLSQSGLRVVAESADICQSVFASFLVRFTAGEFDISHPSKLEGLLITIARRRIAQLVRRETGATRDRRRHAAHDSPEIEDRRSMDPQRIAEISDLLESVRTRLSPNEQQLFDFRRTGMDWDSIAERTNSNTLTLRKRLSRAMQRVCRELGLDDDSIPD